MTSENDFFAKAGEVSATHQQAYASGRKLGTVQQRGIFLGPDAPAHLKNALHPLPTPAEWQARMDRQLEDPVTQKLAPGATVSMIFHKPELRKQLTHDKIELLWAEYFMMHRESDVTPWAWPDMIAEAAARRAAMHEI